MREGQESGCQDGSTIISSCICKPSIVNWRVSGVDIDSLGVKSDYFAEELNRTNPSSHLELELGPPPTTILHRV